MLCIEIKRVPPGGLHIDEAIHPASVHLEAEADFRLHPGGGFRGRVEFVDGDTVHVDGRLASPLEVECGRCLERYPFPVDARLDLFFLKHRPQQPEEQEEDVRLDDRDVVVGYYEGDVLALGAVGRERAGVWRPPQPPSHRRPPPTAAGPTITSRARASASARTATSPRCRTGSARAVGTTRGSPSSRRRRSR